MKLRENSLDASPGGPEVKQPFDDACHALGLRQTRPKARYAWTSRVGERQVGTILLQHWRLAFRRYPARRTAVQRSFAAVSRSLTTTSARIRATEFTPTLQPRFSGARARCGFIPHSGVANVSRSFEVSTASGDSMIIARSEMVSMCIFESFADTPPGLTARILKGNSTAWPVARFLNLAELQQTLQTWRHDYNHHRPHSTLADVPPVEFRAGGAFIPDRRRLQFARG